ncbi:MAG: PilN domain-containing protein [Alphaproteobacteria bacterium]|uniref:PilN domain-containing protein n=1 Tax=Candidatus Nitrobium versatile TaxID=2884831 RepID=A0A953JCU9_9BACT|nr:PilN domain-containing protein [Candidatus Nitrobium versatile]
MMIRINLLTEKRKKKKAAGPSRFLALLAAAVAGALLAMGLATILLKTTVSRLRTESEKNTATIASLSKKINEIKKYERMNKELEQKSGIIEVLRKNQAVPVLILDEVSRVLADGVWLNSLSYKDNAVVLEGHAFTNSDLVAYVNNLKRLTSIFDVYLEESREVEVEKIRVYRFRLNFKVKG